MPWGNLNLNLAVLHKDLNLIRKGGAGMEKERKKKTKKTRFEHMYFTDTAVYEHLDSYF